MKFDTGIPASPCQNAICALDHLWKIGAVPSSFPIMQPSARAVNLMCLASTRRPVLFARAFVDLAVLALC